MSEQRANALKKALTDSDPQVRHAAEIALDQLEGLSALPQILQQLSHGERATRIAMVYALSRLHSSKVFVPLLEALKAEDPDLRAAAASVLGEKHHPNTLPPLVKALDDSEPGVIAEVATALGQFQDSRLPKVLGALLKADEQVALAAIDSLGRLGFPEGEVFLIQALTNESPSVRCHAVEALGKLRLDG